MSNQPETQSTLSLDFSGFNLNINLASEGVGSFSSKLGETATPLDSFTTKFGATAKQLSTIQTQFQNFKLPNLGNFGEHLKKLADPKEAKSWWDKFTGIFTGETEINFWTLVKGALAASGVGSAASVALLLYDLLLKDQPQKLNENDNDANFSPQPSGTTNAQSIAPPKSATSGTLAADLPEGSWTAFLDKTAKVFDEALKAVIKGFDVALAKLVTGEGLKEALEGMEIVVKTEKEIAKAETKAEPKEENMSDSGRTDKDQSQFDNLLKNFHDAFDKIGADFGLSVMQAGAQLVMAGANMVTGAVAMAEGLIKLPMRLLDAFTSLFETKKICGEL